MRARRRGAALGEERALEPVQPGRVAGRLDPVDRRREPAASVQLAAVATARVPRRRGGREPRPQPPPLGILGDPVCEPRPVLDERLVHELHRRLVRDEQPTLDELRDDGVDAVLACVELVAPRRAARRRTPHPPRRVAAARAARPAVSSGRAT